MDPQYIDVCTVSNQSISLKTIQYTFLLKYNKKYGSKLYIVCMATGILDASNK